MSEVTLTAESGRTTGTRPAGRLRATGKVPAVVYGRGMDPVSVAVDRRELRAALHTDAGHNALINLQVGGSSHLTIVKALQRHPVRNDVLHVDFIVIDRDEAVVVEVPVLLEGEAEEVTRAQGTVDQHLFTLTVSAKPGNIPNELVVDVSALTIGDSIKVGDLALPTGVTTDLDPDDTVASAMLTRASLAEGEDGEGAEGADAAAESGSDEGSGETSGD